MSAPFRPNLRQLEYLVALAENLHFRKAALACSISQPALSAQIQALEDLLGVKLFERNKRSVLATPAGREAARRARDILSSLDSLSEAARSIQRPLAGDLRVGVIPTLAPYILPRILPGLRRAHKALRLYLREEFTHDLLQRLSAGDLDVLLLALPVPGDFESLSLFQDAFLLAMPKGDPLAKRETVRMKDLEGREVLLLEDGHCLRDQALAICGRAGATEDVRLRATSLGTLTQMVSNGMGLTLLPETAIEVEGRAAKGVELRRFSGREPSREVGLVWRRTSARGPEFRLLGEKIVELIDGDGH